MHAAAYFGLGLLWSLQVLSTHQKRRIFRKIVIVSAISIAFGIFIEVLQHALTSYRSLDLYDIVANSFGVLGAGIFVWFAQDYLIRFKGKINLFFMKK
jgi:VanZ family protein